MNYLVTGGSGFIGSAFFDACLSDADSVIILSRQVLQTRENVRVISDFSLLGDETAIDCIINLAGKPIDCIWTDKNKRALVSSRCAITESLVGLVQRLKVKPKVMLSASAVGYYGDSNDDFFEETSVGNDSFTHTLCSEWEQSALKMAGLDVRVCLMRLGVVLGRGQGFMKKIALPYRGALGGRLGDGHHPFPWIHIDDVLRVMQFLISHSACSGAYNLVAPDMITNATLTQRLSQSLKRPAFLTVPAWLIRLVFGEMGESLLLKGCRVVPKRLQSAGFVFQYSSIQNAIDSILHSPA